jgi:hypothetical protein
MDERQTLLPEQSKQSIALIAYRAIAWAAVIVVIDVLADHFLWDEPFSWKGRSSLFCIVALIFFVKERGRHRPKNS